MQFYDHFNIYLSVVLAPSPLQVCVCLCVSGSLVYSLARRKFYGAYRIRMEILRKFGRDVTEEYFEECLEGIDFKEYALQYAEKNKKLERKALIGRLRQRGYGAEEIRYALSSLTEE